MMKNLYYTQKNSNFVKFFTDVDVCIGGIFCTLGSNCFPLKFRLLLPLLVIFRDESTFNAVGDITCALTGLESFFLVDFNGAIFFVISRL